MERIGRIIHHLAILNRNDSNQRLKEYGLTSNEGSVLMFLSRHSKVYQEELIKELQIDKSAVTRLLQNMENKGLIKRIQSPVDKRFYLLEMTALGQEKQQIVDQTFAKKDFILVSGLSEKEQEELRRMLDVIQTNLKGRKINE